MADLADSAIASATETAPSDSALPIQDGDNKFQKAISAWRSKGSISNLLIRLLTPRRH